MNEFQFPEGVSRESKIKTLQEYISGQAPDADPSIVAAITAAKSSAQKQLDALLAESAWTTQFDCITPCMGAYVVDTVNGEYLHWGNDPKLKQELARLANRPPNLQVWPTIDIIGKSNEGIQACAALGYLLKD
jgi:hypothetical protein